MTPALSKENFKKDVTNAEDNVKDMAKKSCLLANTAQYVNVFSKINSNLKPFSVRLPRQGSVGGSSLFADSLNFLIPIPLTIRFSFVIAHPRHLHFLFELVALSLTVAFRRKEEKLIPRCRISS